MVQTYSICCFRIKIFDYGNNQDINWKAAKESENKKKNVEAKDG